MLGLKLIHVDRRGSCRHSDDQVQTRMCVVPSLGNFHHSGILFYTTHKNVWVLCHCINTLRPRQNGRHFADDNLKRIFLNENIWISIKISLKFVPMGPINNIPALVQIMAWRRPGDKPLSGPMMFRLLTHICVTRPQWVNPVFLKPGVLCKLWYPFETHLKPTSREISLILDILEIDQSTI